MAELEPQKGGSEEVKVEGSGTNQQYNLPYDQQTQESNNFTIGQSTAETFRNEIETRKFKKFESDFFYRERGHGG